MLRGKKPWTIFGFDGIRGVHRVEAGERPHRREAAEDLVAGDLAPAGTFSAFDDDSSNGMSLPASPWMAAKTSPAAARLEQPTTRGVAGRSRSAATPGPVEVHVHGNGGGRSVVGEPALQLGDLVEPEAGAAELSRNGSQQVTRLAKLVPVLVEEPVLAVVDSGSLSNRASISSVSRSVAVVMVVIVVSVVVVRDARCACGRRGVDDGDVSWPGRARTGRRRR